jgi:hypothetical protein
MVDGFNEWKIISNVPNSIHDLWNKYYDEAELLSTSRLLLLMLLTFWKEEF